MDEKSFKFNIDNIKTDLAIEGMEITESDVDMFKMFANEEMQMPEVINKIVNESIKNI